MIAAAEVSVRVCSWSPKRGVLAFVALDGEPEVRVRIKVRKHGPPRWLCDEHWSTDGRRTCPHIEALARTVPERRHIP